MNRGDAEALAKKIAVQRGWTWLEPVKVHRGRRWLFGRAQWTVISNAESMGCNVRVVIDEATGDVVQAGFNPR